ncbi:mechanosensitive ion channel protein MscS [Vibrio splendidus]|uniref:Mechanosensitive ion channel family protein n=2 Tax=Vibrio splendidus TaxID=29497 RepID=A0A2G4AY49_VIBSP|nr:MULTISPECIES: mechanosensitive ion channel family protein [Vibrio]MBO7911265.1 mechanosensitive ion channel family protein [Vibrio sp. G41H]MBT9241632.1 mechanosensitive ion channel family protein [Vibrio splendidus]MCC5517031.1 mechanosensitive ion channel family protein [Vibrio splendidus]MCF7490100.1 mechanosensitive ion channel family protein [Vibrio sp. G-C-1]MCW4445918.1 mechanosensitive ion channel family protein [Vibrio splendidus]
MNEFITQVQTYINQSHSDWANSVLFITIASFFAWVAWRIVHNRLEILVKKTQFHWDDLLLEALKTPVSTLLWCWPATVSVGLILQDQFGNEINWLRTLKHILIISTFVWFTLRMISNSEEYVLEQKTRDETTVQAIAKVARLFFMVMGGLTIMQAFGLSLSGLLTFGGVGGLIVGLAAKDLLSNFFGGMMIYFDRPFKVGDWIRSPDRQIEGTVERIGWRMTIIRTFDKRPLYVPNSVFSSIVVENPSRMLNRRINETFGLRYQDADKLALIVDDVRTMLETHPDIDAKQTLIVNFDKFGPSTLNFFIYTFTKTVNWIRYHKVKQDVLLQVLAIIHKHNADIAFPTQTLKIDPQDFSNVQGHNSVQSLGDNQNVSDPKDMLNSPTEGHR